MPCICKECGLQFDNRGLHDSHWKKCVKTVTFVAPTGEDVTVTCDRNGTFVCYCSHDKCPKENGFATVGALQRHMKTLKTTWLGPEKKAEGGEESSGKAPALEIDIGNPQISTGTIHTPEVLQEVAMASPNSPSPRSPMAMQVPSLMVNQAESSSAPAGTQPHFIHQPYLDSLNLVVNAELCFLTCQLCKEGVAPTAGQAHLVNKHVELLPTFDQECFDSILVQLQVAASLPNLAGPRSIIHGLMVFDAITCKFCTVIYTKQKNMREHHMKKHPDMPIPQLWQSCKAQHIKPEGAGTVHQLWEVTTQARAGEDSRERALADKLLGELEEQLKTVQVPKDNWLVSPWLLTTHWHEWAWRLRKPTEELCAMVTPPRPSLPKEEHYKTLVETIKLYFEEAVPMINSMDELVLQWLNSPDPTKGISNMPFHRHQHDGTLKKYMHPLICFITMLLLDDMLQEEASEQSCILAQLHTMLLKVWTTPWSKSKYHIVPDPTESCLALLTLNWDGSFKSTKEVTTLIAKFEYCMHLTFLREIRAHASAGDIEVDEEAACDALQPWFTKKNYSTFAQLCSLQHRASAISFSTMALPSIWWTDMEAWSTLSFKGNHIAFMDICEIFKDVEEALVATWENKVLKGLELREDYDQVVDDPSNKDVGYSFLFDPGMLVSRTEHVCNILIQNLALACPFAEIAVRICFADEEVSQLYHDHLFVNFDRLFTSNDLSTVMAKYSLPWVKFAMTINPWQHVQTTWKCKFKCAMDDVVEMDMEDDIDALQAGHSHATENRVQQKTYCPSSYKPAQGGKSGVVMPSRKPSAKAKGKQKETGDEDASGKQITGKQVSSSGLANDSTWHKLSTSYATTRLECMGGRLVLW
ncbi:hypothetical protein EDC04DRAFT_2608529 [Pisolithus marmoratus]|nr:hypothetical protein EDC04DRAFT_2608529 [Pisolithus marmoratus]